MAAPDTGGRMAPPGLIQSLKTFLRTWVELFRTRLDLLSTELQEERQHLQQIVILGAAALLCITFGVLLVTLFFVAVFWDTNYRLAVLGGFAVFYLGTGIIVGLITRRKSRLKPKLFTASLAELAKDYSHLSSR